MLAMRGAPTLILVPTELELARLEDQGGFPPGAGLVHTLGFGPIAAAARASALIARLSPARVVLLGIAGTFDAAAWPVGSAAEFARVAVEGIGVGAGERLQAPPALGFPQWPGAGAVAPIHDLLELAPLSRNGGAVAPLLLSTCAASADRAQADLRRRRFPTAAAEDMEGFGVALACALAGVPLSVVRGFSNTVGDRDPAHWRIPGALAAARGRALELLAP